MYLDITQLRLDILSTLSIKFIMMSTITYASFPDPRFLDDEPSSPTIHPLEQLSLMDESLVTSAPVVDLNIIDLVREDEDCVTGLTNRDGRGYHLAPSTPTKGRARRATMPESLNHRPHEVSPPFPAQFNL